MIITSSSSKFSYADVSIPRYVRVNTLKMDVDSALRELRENYMVLLSKYFFIIKILLCCLFLMEARNCMNYIVYMLESISCLLFG